MVNKELLKQTIIESGLKMNFIADKLGISRWTLTKKLNGESDFKQPEITALCKLLNLSSTKMIKEIFFT